MNAPLKSWLALACCTLGLALSLYLALLKIFSLPCIGIGNCHAIIHSAYGSVFRVPVGVFGALLWSAAILVRDRSKRTVLLAMLSGGAAIYMSIQFFVLKGFCLYCTLHAVVAWCALALNSVEPRRWLVLSLAPALALGCFFLNRQLIAGQTSAHPPARVTLLADSIAALPWLGEIDQKSRVLILSVNCPACLDLLDELNRRSYAQTQRGPAIFFKTTAENRALTQEVIAATLAQQTPTRREAFLGVVTILLTQKEAVLSSPDAAAGNLRAIFSAANERREAASRLLALQHEVLSGAHLPDTTPLLVESNGSSRAFFKPEEIFQP